jgi:hypothetical protein
MERTRVVALWFFAVTFLALLAPGKASAGPPEGASGKMMFDEVADGLRRYRRDISEDRKLERLRRLAPTGDLRVVVLLGEELSSPSEAIRLEAARALLLIYAAPKYQTYQDRLIIDLARDIWRLNAHYFREMANEAVLRRRAAQLPR